jgi:hypothetical protein
MRLPLPASEDERWNWRGIASAEREGGRQTGKVGRQGCRVRIEYGGRAGGRADGRTGGEGEAERERGKEGKRIDNR